MKLLQLVLFVLFGTVAASLLGLRNIEDTSWYLLFTGSLLAIGLYASTYGIVLKEARQHLRIILMAVTVGVVLKAALIGVSLALIFQDPFYLILGIVVTQIDPLSVSGLMRGSRLSSKAKAILGSWASFDDPITVILALYAPLLVAQFTGADLGSITGSNDTGANLFSYIVELGLNLGLAAQAFCLFTVIRYYANHISAWLAFGVSLASYALLAVAFSISLLYFMMLGIALIGLFLRPPIDRAIDIAITWALRLAAILLGILLVGGINVVGGIALGIAAYGAQVAVGFLLTRGLAKKDRWHIAFAQQNGITAIILALLFEPIHPGTVAIVAPAIVVINGIHDVANRVIDKHVLVEKS